ncbi:MAG: hypothetical protein AB8B78_13845 [Polaribacter sp.]
MIFYGTKGSHIHTEKTNGIKCDNCNEIVPHTISIYGKYGYLYWVPVFPMSKKAFTECTNCKVTLDFKGMNEKLRHASADAKRKAKTPIWYWSGLAIIALLISLIVYNIKEHDKEVVNYIQEPKVGDVIKFKNVDTNYYSTLKISLVTKDSIFVIQNDYETDKTSGVYKIDLKSNYTTDPFGLGKNQIQQMFDDGTFYDIER